MTYLATRMLLCLLCALAIGLVVGWLLRRFSAIEREAELGGEIDLREERLGALESEVGERDQKIMALGSDLSGLQRRVPDLESTLAQRDDQVMSLTMDLDGWKDKVPGLERQLADSSSERDRLSADLAERVRLLETSDAETRRLNAELATLRGELAANSERAAREAAELGSEITDQKQQLDAVRKELDDAKTASAQVAEQRDRLQGEYDALKLHSDAQTTDARDREQALAELRSSLKSQDAERTSLAQQLSALAPVASRVDSQDASIVSLNNDLRARDTTIKSLRDQLAANAKANDELQGQMQSMGLLQGELDGLRDELAGANQRLSMADAVSHGVGAELSKAKGQTANLDREWRTRLRIAESGRQQVQADLYRRQEQIERLEKQLLEARGDSQQQRRDALAARTAADTRRAIFKASDAGQIKATDDRDWRAQLRVAESARRQAQAQALRESDQVKRLESELRELKREAVPGRSIALARSQPLFGAPVSENTSAADALNVPKEVQPSPFQKALQRGVPEATVERDRPTENDDLSPKSKSAKKSEPEVTPTSSEADTELDDSRFLDTKPQEVDDLREIKGVGKVLQKTLNSLGIYQFRQVARFTEQDIAWVDDRLKFKGRIERDNWVKQATKLHRKKYGRDPVG